MNALNVAIGLVLGILATAAGQLLTHRFTSTRDRRADVISTLDRAFKGLIAGNHRIQQFISKAGTGAPPQVVQLAADEVSAQQIEMRAAIMSLDVRLKPGDPILRAFREAEEHFEAAFVATQPMLERKELGRAAAQPAYDQLRLYNEACDAAVAEANKRFAGSRRGAS